MPTEQQVKDWYNKRYASQGTNSMRPYEAYPKFLDYLTVAKGKKLLDIGCGTGFLLLEASKRGLKTFGLDISEEAVNIARSVSPDSVVSAGASESLKFEDSTFDYVYCLGALEHFLDINKAIQEMKRVAKPDATFCIMVPNCNFLFWKISGKLGTEQQDINERLLSLKEWQAIFSSNGLKTLKIYQDKWPARILKILASTNPLGILKRTLIRIAWTFLPLNYTYQFVFVLRKA